MLKWLLSIAMFLLVGVPGTAAGTDQCVEVVCPAGPAGPPGEAGVCEPEECALDLCEPTTLWYVCVTAKLTPIGPGAKRAHLCGEDIATGRQFRSLKTAGRRSTPEDVEALARVLNKAERICDE